jgi:ABC-type nitrate/sulfonate/bicarbonate transport system substrate-binding protein
VLSLGKLCTCEWSATRRPHVNGDRRQENAHCSADNPFQTLKETAMGQLHFGRRAGLVAATIALASAWQGAAATRARAAPAEQRDAVVIRYLSARGNITTYELADALGWLKDKNIRIESEGYSQGGPESLVALASGSVDIAGAATPAIINAIAAGAKILGIMPDGGINKDVNSKFFVLAGSNIHSAKDLQGKSIAVNTLGAHLDYTVREYLRTHGIGPDAVNLITVPGPQLEQILRHKQADVVAVGAWQSVFAGKIEKDGGVRVLFTDYDVLGAIVLGTDAMEKSFIVKNTQAVQDFVAASARAADWSIQHSQDARKLVAAILKKRGDNPDLAQYWPGYGLRQHALYTPHDAQFWIDVLVRAGRLKPGQLTPTNVDTNAYNGFAKLAQN